MRFSTLKNSQSGQILLVVVLAAVVSLTVGLAAVSRTITNTRVSTEEANSQKALAAAEAGVEEQIQKTKIAGDAAGDYRMDFSNSSDVVASSEVIEPSAGSTFSLNDGAEVLQDEGADIWLSKQDFTGQVPNTTLTLTWDTLSNCREEVAIEVVVISGLNKDNPNMNRYTADGCAQRRSENNFNSSGHSLAIPISNGFIARVIPLYAKGKINVHTTQALPAQGYRINSTGTSGGTVRKVKVFQGHPSLPIEFFPYNLFIP